MPNVMAYILYIFFVLVSCQPSSTANSSLGNDTSTFAPTTPTTLSTSKVTTKPTLGTSTKKCQEDQFKYVYTECDVQKGRWKVAVPRSPNLCDPVDAPKPEWGKKCTFVCPEGQYLEVKTQKCNKCPAGMYSQSSKVKFNSWKKLPVGFETWGINSNEADGPKNNKRDCKSKIWVAKGNYIESAGDFCKSVLVYSATLEKPGNISIVHRADDDMAFFHVKVVNSFCTASSNGRHSFYLDSEIKWKRTFVPLNRGRNVIFLEAAYYYGPESSSSWTTDDSAGRDSNDRDRDGESGNPKEESKSLRRKSVQVREIAISGLPFTSECTKCDAGTYSAEGSSSCETCDANTFSDAGAAACTKCANNQYSDRGSSKCLERPKCSEKDFYEMWTPCDVNGKTMRSYFWVIPKICQGGTELPKTNNVIDCPPCNPGQFKNGSICSFCGTNEYSDGSSGCKKCPPLTTPDVGLFFNWWQNIPKNVLNFYCFSKTERSCKSGNGWRQYNTYMDSGVGHSDDTELGLYFDVTGFKDIHSVLTIEFEVECKSQCRLILESRRDSEARSVIFNLRGTQRKTKYRHLLNGIGMMSFSLKFIKPEGDSKNHYDFPEDRVRLYVLNVTNALNGGADRCIDCPLGVGAKGKGCIQCEKGSYLVKNKCVKCPAGTYLDAKNPVGKKACRPCSRGTTSLEGSTYCFSNCHIFSESGRHYNFSALAGSILRKNSQLFTSHGYPYYRLFNITVCGGPYAMSQCYNNFSQAHDDGKREKLSTVNSLVCRSTVIPSHNEKSIFTQSMSLGDILESVTFGSLNKDKTNETEKAADAEKSRRRVRKDNHEEDDSLPTDVNFIFKSQTQSAHCKDGYRTIVTLRCDHSAPNRGYVKTMPECSVGTCDGCLYHFFWHSEYACPLCTHSEYQNITSACNNGQVKTQYVWNYPKMCRDGVELPKAITRKCSVFERTILDLKLFLFVFLGMVALLILGIVILCYRNRSLNYKYSRLVDEAHYKDGELPASEKCTLEDGEEDEIILSRGPGGNGRRILDRLRKIGSPKNRDDFSGFETINLTERVVDHSSGDEI